MINNENEFYLKVYQELKKSILSGINNKTSISNLFIRNWFFSDQSEVSNDNSLFILYWKNASVTNVQYLETKSLLNIYATTNIEEYDFRRPIFYTENEIKLHIQDLLESVLYNYESNEEISKHIDNICETVIENHYHIFFNTIIIDHYYTSSTIHFPESIRVDIERIIAYSGYIHSIGNLIYGRNINKIKNLDIKDKLENLPQSKKPISFVVYADKHFIPHDSGAVSVRNGLNEVMLKAKKHHFQNIELDDFLLEINKIDDIHIMPGKNDFVTEREEQIKNNDVAKECSLWVITDRNLENSPNSRFGLAGEKSYIFLYKQTIQNANPLVTLKERKPGWVQSVTLPHTLSKSLYAISAQHINNKKTVRILDPFVGTGTTLIDGCYMFNKCEFTGLDKDPFCDLIVKDNLEFFSYDSKQLANFIEMITQIINGKNDYTETKLEQFKYNYNRNSVTQFVANILSKFLHSIIESTDLYAIKNNYLIEELPTAHIDILENLSIELRLIYFLTWRAIRLNKYELIHNGLTELPSILEAEFKKFKNEIEHIARDHETTSIIDQNGNTENNKNLPFETNKGVFSKSLCYSRSFFEELKNDLTNPDNKRANVINVSDSVEFLKTSIGDNSFDIVITDPPYGFNTEEGGTGSLHNMYGKLFDQLARTLDYGGQLFVCLPANARTGKVIPFYQTRRSVVQRIIRAFYLNNKSLISYSEPRLLSGSISNPPYYWGNNSAVSRDVLHFIVERK